MMTTEGQVVVSSLADVDSSEAIADVRLLSGFSVRKVSMTLRAPIRSAFTLIEPSS
jgi:hypothetical protein